MLASSTHPTSSSQRFDFVYAVCQLGAEPALKAEVARLLPGWRFAYSRPGFMTWRTDAAVGPELQLPLVFGRAFGVSLGKVESEATLLEQAALVQAAGEGRALHLHVFERDRARPGATDEGDSYGPLATALRERLLATSPRGLFVESLRPPQLGEAVLDVIVAPGEPLWLGLHTHDLGHSPHPGGRLPLQLPVAAPSRAWLKLEEALAFSRLPLRRGQTAVEIGSAPGGASWALLRRGLHVVGVDPGAMDARVLAEPGFAHLQLPLGELRREQLPETVDWLLLDVNLAPQVALHGVKRIVSTLRGTIRGAIFTLKLNDWSLAAEVPALLSRVAGMGLPVVRATQLPSNRREICVIAEPAEPPRRRLVGSKSLRSGRRP